MKYLIIALLMILSCSIIAEEQSNWVPGHWVQVEGQYVWINGYQTQTVVPVNQPTTTVIYVQQPVQTVYVEQPRSSFVFYGSFGFNGYYGNRGCFSPFVGHRR